MLRGVTVATSACEIANLDDVRRVLSRSGIRQRAHVDSADLLSNETVNERPAALNEEHDVVVPFELGGESARCRYRRWPDRRPSQDRRYQRALSGRSCGSLRWDWRTNRVELALRSMPASGEPPDVGAKDESDNTSPMLLRVATIAACRRAFV